MLSELFKRGRALLIVLVLCTPLSVTHVFAAKDDLISINPGKILDRNDLERIYQYKLDHGFQNLSIVSEYLLRLSARALEKGRFDKAVELVEYAQKCSPNYPPVYTSLGRIYWARNPLHVYELFTGWINAFRAALHNYHFTIFILINIVLSLVIALLLTIAVFSIISLYKYSQLLIHDLTHILPLPCLVVWLWSGVIFALPFLFHFSIVLAFFFWLLLLFVYHSKREQLIILVFVSFLVSSPFIVRIISQSVTTPFSGVVYQLYQVNQESWDRAVEEKLLNWVDQNPEDIDALFSLALLKKKQGRYDEAKRYYEEVLRTNPDHYRALCNLGNVFLAKNLYENAISLYDRCIEVSPASVEGHYNLSRAYLLNYNFNESKQSFNRARELNPKRVDYYSTIYSKNMNRAVVDETIPLNRFWEQTFSSPGEKEPPDLFLWRWLFKGIPYSYRYSFLIVFALFLYLMFLSGGNQNFPQRCAHCGTAVCIKCRAAVRADNLCAGCVAVFKGKGLQISAREKMKKVMHVERFQKTQSVLGRLFAVLLPGSGHLLSGSPVKGTVLLFLFFIVAIRLFCWEGPVINPWLVGHVRSYDGIVLLGATMGILYFISIMNIKVFSKKLSQILSLTTVIRRELQI